MASDIFDSLSSNCGLRFDAYYYNSNILEQPASWWYLERHAGGSLDGNSDTICIVALYSKLEGTFKFNAQSHKLHLH